MGLNNPLLEYMITDWTVEYANSTHAKNIKAAAEDARPELALIEKVAPLENAEIVRNTNIRSPIKEALVKAADNSGFLLITKKHKEKIPPTYNQEMIPTDRSHLGPEQAP